MQIIVRNPNFRLLRFLKNEEVISGLIDFCQSETLEGAVFEALGAATKVELGYYDLKTRQYVRHLFEEDLEVSPMIGNIGWMNNEPVIHAHGSFGRKDFTTLSGHVFSLLVGGTLEVHLRILSKRLERGYDEETGLNLLRS